MPSDAVELSTKTPSGKLRLLSIAHLDGRTAAARRCRELIDAIEADLGGSDSLSEGERQLVRRAAVLGVMIESSETRWLAGEAAPMDDYLQALNAQRRVLSTLGLERRSRDVTPTLGEYLKQKAAEKAGQ